MHDLMTDASPTKHTHFAALMEITGILLTSFYIELTSHFKLVMGCHYLRLFFSPKC